MQEKFKKAAAGAVGLLTAGATLAAGFAGVAFGTDLSDFAAGNVFTTENTIVVVGPNAAMADNVGAINIGAKLAQAGATYTGTSAVTTAAGVVSLNTANTKIYAGDALNKAKSFISKAELPVLLADGTVDVDGSDKKITNQRITLTANAKVILGKDDDSVDPDLYVTGTTASSGFGTSASSPLYNISASFETANLTNAIGKKMTLFGKEFTIAPTTTTTSLVLYSSATEVSLNRGETVTVTIGGTEHTIKLVAVNTNGDKATVEVDGKTDDVDEGASKKVNSVNIYIDRASAYQEVVDGVALNSGSATLLVGSEKVTIPSSGTITTGDDADDISGTRATATGGYGALTSLTISVAGESSSTDYIKNGGSLTDRVFGTFKINFEGTTPASDDTNTDSILIASSGNKAMQVTLIDLSGTSASVPFAYSATPETAGTATLNYDSNSAIATAEGQILRAANGGDYFVAYGDDVGKLLHVDKVDTDGSSNDKVIIKDVFSGETVYENNPNTASADTFIVGNRVYTIANTTATDEGNITVTASGTTGGATITGSNVGVFNPITGKNGEYVYMYYPITSGLNATSIVLPDGTKSRTTLLASSVTGSPANVTVGPLAYTIGGVNSTGGTVGALSHIQSVQLRPTGTAVLSKAAVVVLENNNDVDSTSTLSAHVISVDGAIDTNKMGISTQYSSAAGVSSSYSTQAYESDSDVSVAGTVYGTMVVYDSSSQGKVTLTYPDTQTYANLYLSEVAVETPSASSTDAIAHLSLTADGVARLASDASVAADKLEKNVVLVGGPAINSLVEELATAEKTPDVTYYRDETKEGSLKGKALIQVIDNAFADGMAAIVVSGYEADQTRAASLKLATEEMSGTAVELEGSEVVAYDFEAYKLANAAAAEAVDDTTEEDATGDETTGDEGNQTQE
ncbi:MAG: S-layer protein [Candidatus Aenigmarchaeota archaeon]|nr:S-layer protein [Candidatus Aenigmarchaeota archaeon]